MKKKKILALLIGTLALVSFAEAEEVSGSDRPRPVKDARMELQKDRQGIKDQFKVERDGFRKEADTKRDSMKQNIQENRQEFKDSIPEMRKNGEKGDIKDARMKMHEENKEMRRMTVEEIKAKREEIKSKFKDEIKNFKEGRKQILDTAKKERVKTNLNGIFTRFASAITNTERFDAKLSEIISKRKANNVDVSIAEDRLAEARNNLDEARAAIEAIKSASTEAVSDTEGVSKEALKASVGKAHEAVKEARQSYKSVVDSLRSTPKAEEASESENGTKDNTESSN